MERLAQDRIRAEERGIALHLRVSRYEHDPGVASFAEQTDATLDGSALVCDSTGIAQHDIFTDAPSDRTAAQQRAARDGELKAVEGGVTRWKRADGTTGSGIFTYMMQPLWTTGGDIDALLFIGLARSGGPGARRPAGAARSANARLPRRSDRARRTTRAALEDRPAA